MTTIDLEIPDSILQAHQQNLADIAEEAKQGFIVWQYLNGYLTLKQSAEILKLPYRAFINLLLSHSINIDGLTNEEINQQQSHLNLVPDSLSQYAKSYIPTEQAREQAWQDAIKKQKYQAIMNISKKCASLPVLDTRTPDEVLGYDQSPMGLWGDE